MTKEITKAFILQQIQDKFKLRELVPEKFTFSEQVIPVYSIDPHLEQEYTVSKTESITATGAVEFQVVPKNERWYLRRYDVIFLASGAYTIAGVYTNRVNKATAGSIVYLDLTAAISASYHIDLINPVKLESGDRIFVNVDGYTSTADLRIIIDYKREEIR